MTEFHWLLSCSECTATATPEGLPTICPACGAPWLVSYPAPPGTSVRDQKTPRPWSMWRYREWLPILADEEPVTLGEGATPLVPAPSLCKFFELGGLWIKDEALNPTASFKARGLSAAVTRAKYGGARLLTTPTAGNAGVSLAAYGTRAGAVRVWAPESTPPRILEQIRLFGADLELLDGHIGDCGRVARAYAEKHGGFDVSTLKEPYRIEGKKTLGLEIAEAFGWRLPDAIVYPTGGGTGLIGMWKCFNELRDAGWFSGKLPRLYSVQSTGCAPVIRALETGASHVDPWENPVTVASGLRVPAPFGGRLILRALRETSGTAVAVSDEQLETAATRLALETGVDASPEGGSTLAALDQLMESGHVRQGERVILFNTGAGWLYRQ